MKIDHIAIAVNDVEEAAKTYKEALGVEKIEYETVESEGVKLAILHLENGRIELMPCDVCLDLFYLKIS